MPNKSDIVICEPLRTPIGRFGGVFATMRPAQLAALVIAEVVKRTGISPDAVDEVILGHGYPSSEAPAIGRVKLEPYLAARDSEETRRVKARWPEVLQRVKDVRISVHAWLIDGEPVSAADGRVLIAFRNTMHRQTTEKPANREIIEGVMAEVFGAPMRFQTVMAKEWQEAAAGGERPKPEALELAPEEDQAEPGGRPPWVEEAVKLFGEELVVVVDDEDN